MIGGTTWLSFSESPARFAVSHGVAIGSRPMANAPFAELPEAFRRLQQHLLKRPGGDRKMVDVLALVLQHDEGPCSARWTWP